MVSCTFAQNYIKQLDVNLNYTLKDTGIHINSSTHTNTHTKTLTQAHIHIHGIMHLRTQLH